MSLLTADQALPGFRGAMRCMVRSASSFRGRLSIHPKQSSSSTRSGQDRYLSATCLRDVTSQTLPHVGPFAVSHARSSAADPTSTRGRVSSRWAMDAFNPLTKRLAMA